MEKIDARLFQAFREYLENYLPNVRARSANTVEAYRAAINLFNEFIKDRDGKELYQVTVADYNEESILSFMDWLEKERNNSVSTVNQRLMEIRSFSKYLMKDDPALIGTLSKILDISKRQAPPRNDLVYLTSEQLELLFRQPDISTRKGLRDRFFLELMYDSGCRDQEILDLRVKDFVVGNGSACIKVVGKGGKFRVTPITTKILPLYNKYKEAYLKDCSPDDNIFYTVRGGIRFRMSDDNVARFMNKYEKMIKEDHPDFPHLHPHLLRHSRAMNLYINGMPLPMISEWLGHTQLETTTIYAQATTEMKRKASEKADKEHSSIFPDEEFKYANDEDVLKRLYGLK